MLELLDGAMQREVAFPRCDESELGQSADFRRKRASLDAEVVRELLAVEWNVEFGCAFLLCHGAQIGHQPILGGTMRQDLDLAVQFESLHCERAHDVPDKAGVERAGTLARRDDTDGFEQKHYAVLVCLHVNTDHVRARQRLRSGDDSRRFYQLDQRPLAVCIACRDSKRAGKDMEDIIS